MSEGWTNCLRESYQEEEGQEGNVNQGGKGHGSAIEYLSNLNEPYRNFRLEYNNSFFFLLEVGQGKRISIKITSASCLLMPGS